MILSALAFERQLSRFRKVAGDNLAGGLESFRNALPVKDEAYKSLIRDRATELLDVGAWNKDSVGSGSILKRVIKAIEIDEPGGLRNNLVTWQNRYGHKGRSHRTFLDATTDRVARRAIEEWFYNFFLGSPTDADAFENLRSLAGDRYDLLAYVFFLKDWTRFMPIATTTFDEAFEALEIDLTTSRRCSWDNYRQYNESLSAIRDALRDLDGWDGVRLIDAHSFCWVLIRREPADEPPAVVIPPPQTVTPADVPLNSQREAPGDGPFPTVPEGEFERRAAAQRRLGRIAQDVALVSEKLRLREAGHTNPDEVVRAVWDQPARGYDIESAELDGSPRYIEVKSARQAGQVLSFFVSENEARQSRVLTNYFFYLVLNADTLRPRSLAISGRDLPADWLVPVNYRASVPMQ